MVDEELRQRIAGTAIEGRIQCSQALAIARELRIPPGHVGEVLNGMNIRIVKCQLGCFP